MNFFAHGIDVLDQPYVLSGTATPDWLNYVDRRIRAREKLAEPFCDDVDPKIAAIARGIVKHHRDDRWFHGSRVFTEMSMRFAIDIRDRLPQDDGFRPSFLGHILIELLLDSHLHETQMGALDRYYGALRSVSPGVVQSAVNRITGKPTQRLAVLLPRFIEERFLFDYADDAQLLVRLNQVMRRIGLDRLPDSLTDYIADVRPKVADAAELLLTPPE